MDGWFLGWMGAVNVFRLFFRCKEHRRALKAYYDTMCTQMRAYILLQAVAATGSLAYNVHMHMVEQSAAGGGSGQSAIVFDLLDVCFLALVAAILPEAISFCCFLQRQVGHRGYGTEVTARHATSMRREPTTLDMQQQKHSRKSTKREHNESPLLFKVRLQFKSK